MSDKSKEILLQEKIAELDFALDAQRKNIISLKKQLSQAESELIFLKLQKEKATELLTTTVESDPTKVVKTLRELDIERFRAVLPETLEKINKKDGIK